MVHLNFLYFNRSWVTHSPLSWAEPPLWLHPHLTVSALKHTMIWYHILVFIERCLHPNLDYCNSLLIDLDFSNAFPSLLCIHPTEAQIMSASLPCLSIYSILSVNFNFKFLIVVCMTQSCLAFPIHFLVFFALSSSLSFCLVCPSPSLLICIESGSSTNHYWTLHFQNIVIF